MYKGRLQQPMCVGQYDTTGPMLPNMGCGNITRATPEMSRLPHACPPCRFCQRIVPLDSTCECTPEGWSRAAAQAAAAYRARRAAAAAAGQGASTPEAPIAFAVAIRTRSNEPTAAGAAEGAADGTAAEGERASGAGKDGGELDRPRMLSLAAAAMSEAFSSCGGAVVNLKKPQVMSRQGVWRVALVTPHILFPVERFTGRRDRPVGPKHLTPKRLHIVAGLYLAVAGYTHVMLWCSCAVTCDPRHVE